MRIAHGWAIHPPSGASFSYGELTQGHRLTQEFDDDAPITPPQEWMAAGVSIPPLDGHAVVTGAKRYTSDMQPAGALAGAVLRPPAPGATLVALDTSAAAAIAGVQVVHDGAFIGVVAPDRATALQARDTIRAEWNIPAPISSAELYDYLRTHPIQLPAGTFGGPMLHEQGDLAAALAAAPVVVRASYTVAPIAHAPLEPRAAIAEWNSDRLTVWTGTQKPFPVRAELAAALGVAEEHVRVIVPPTGSGFGGKHTGEAAIEAARLARAAGRPVKIVWTREEEFADAYVRPAGAIDIALGAAPDGAITAYAHDTFNAGAAGIRSPYAIPHQRLAFHPSASPMRQGSYRALAATANAFARECALDELALRLGVDPLALRLQNLSDERMRAVLEAAAELFDWRERTRGAGRGYGIAAGAEKGGYVATCAEVALAADGDVRVVRVAQAFECGAIVNPGGLRSQIEGAIVQGLGGALYEQVTIEQGRITSTHFSSYRVPRFGDMPAIAITLLDRRDIPSAGGSETPIIIVAPAIANAIADANGVRLRAMPLMPSAHESSAPST